MFSPAESIAFNPMYYLRNIGQRMAALSLEHGDINAYWQLQRDMCELADLSGSNLGAANYANLQSGISALETFLQASRLPDDEQAALLRSLSALYIACNTESTSDDAELQLRSERSGQPGADAGQRVEKPPKAYWRRWAGDAETAVYPEQDALGRTASEENKN